MIDLLKQIIDFEIWAKQNILSMPFQASITFIVTQGYNEYLLGIFLDITKHSEHLITRYY